MKWTQNGRTAWAKAEKIAPFWVFLFFGAFTLLLYKATLLDLPRSDHVILFAIFQDLRFPADISKIAFLEFFGDPRFQPLTWLLHYFQAKVFGSNFVFYHLVVVMLHALNGMLVYWILTYLLKTKLLSFLAAFVFISLFTNLPMIAWPLPVYSLLSVTLTLITLLCLLRFYRGSRPAFLYASYGLAFVQLFLYELNIVVPAFIFLISMALGWTKTGRKRLWLTNAVPVVAIYAIYGGLYLWLMPQYAGLPQGVLSIYNVRRALYAVPIEIVNTVIGHNIFASSQIVFDELTFYVPFSAKSLSLAGGDIPLHRLDLLVYLMLFGLVIALRRPRKGQMILLGLLGAWVIAYTTMLFLGRGVAYVISQGRHAYFPALLLIIIGAHFYQRYFTTSSVERKRQSLLLRSGADIVVIACFFFISLNTVKTFINVNQYMEYREYTNSIYYAAHNWQSDPANKENKLFLSVTTYPPDEKLAWGADIIPALFLDYPQIARNYREATHILDWKDGQRAPVISIIEHVETNPSDDFMLVFGVMSHTPITESEIEIFAPRQKAAVAVGEKSWWFRLIKEERKPGQAGQARIALVYSQDGGAQPHENTVFLSKPLDLAPVKMNHFVLVRENKTFGLIFNGKLVDKVYDGSGDELNDIDFSLGKLYRMGYRKPYFFAHTFIGIGKTTLSIKDKELGHTFSEIKFNPRGFQEYHLSLDF